MMASLARADLESLLHTKKLGRTLTSGLPALRADLELASTGHVGLDAQLRGGIPRGHVSELVGPRSSGCSSLLLRLIWAATARRKLAALADALDTRDAPSA